MKDKNVELKDKMICIKVELKIKNLIDVRIIYLFGIMNGVCLVMSSFFFIDF